VINLLSIENRIKTIQIGRKIYMTENQELYIGAVLLEDGDEVPCSGPKSEIEAWALALKKKEALENQKIEVVDAYVFKVPIWNLPRVYE
jgi:hypothetical protein